jgi:phytoene dehydrogenase-like protein
VAYDAVVVGSGPNGLVGAALLADAGWRVLVVEAARVAGGGLRTEQLTLPGFAHDVCSSVHALALASPAFRALRLEEDGLEWAHPDVPAAHPLDDGPAALLHRDPARTAAGLGADGRAWLSTVAATARAGLPLVDTLLQPLSPPRAPVALARYGLTGIWPAARLGRAALRTEAARGLLAGLSAHSVLDLRAPATAGYGLFLGALAHLVGWPVAVGGSQSIADALVRRLRSRGGELVTGTRVGSLAELPPARAVLLDLTPRQVLAVAGDVLPAGYRRRLARFRYGWGVFKVDWALAGPVPWRDPAVGAAGTVHVGGTMAEVVASEQAVAAGRVSDRPFVMFVQATVADPSRAPAGQHTAWAYCHVPNGCPVDQTGAIERQVERFAPGFADLVLARHTFTPAELETHNPNEVGGDIGGGSADLRQFVARPVASLHPWATPVAGLYLCSASTPPGGGAHGMGGAQAARLALRRDADRRPVTFSPSAGTAAPRG